MEVYQIKAEGSEKWLSKKENSKTGIVTLSLRIDGPSVFTITHCENVSQVLRCGGLKMELLYRNKSSQMVCNKN
jgi:hypothetical protein